MPFTRADPQYASSPSPVFDAEIKLMRIYRTKKGTTSPFYLVEEKKPTEIPVSGLLYYYQDNIADANLGEEYGTTLSNSADNVMLKSTLLYSNLFKPNEFPELNLQQVFPDDNDAITGIFDDDNGIIIFKERSICKLYTNGDPTNWQIAKLVTNVGCDEPDSIYKYSNEYFFMYQKRIYKFDGRGIKNISETRRDTFDSVTAINGATFWHDGLFYVLSVNIGTGYYLLTYDTKLDGWYKWSIFKADSITTKFFGPDKGKILLGGSEYIVYYNESQDYDTDQGTRADITVNLKTKDYLVDGFINMRLWMLMLDYRKLLNRNTDTMVFLLTDPAKPTNLNSYNDNSSIVAYNKFKLPTDSMVGTLKRARTINFSFSGVSMDKFVNARLDYMPEHWGIERRSPGKTKGLGISHGSEAGVSD